MREETGDDTIERDGAKGGDTGVGSCNGAKSPFVIETMSRAGRFELDPTELLGDEFSSCFGTTSVLRSTIPPRFFGDRGVRGSTRAR